MSETVLRRLDGLADLKGKTRIQARIDRMALTGSPGDCKALKGEDGLFEMRVDVGSGYRVYIIRRGRVTVVLPAGGDFPAKRESKSTQRANIERAARLAKEWR